MSSSKQVASLAPLPPTLPGGALPVQAPAPEDPKPTVASDAISLSAKATGKAKPQQHEGQAVEEAAEPKAKPARKRHLTPPAPPARPQSQPQGQSQSQSVAKPAVGLKIRVTGLASFFSTSLTSWLFDPRLLVSNIRSVFAQVYRLAVGTRQAHTIAVGLRAARKEGQANTYVRTVLDELGKAGQRAAAGAWNKVLNVFGKGTMPASAVEAAAPALEANRGLFGWARAARAEGMGPLKAIATGFKRTVETGGDMPRIVAQAREMKGVWGKAFEVTGKIARLAPLLNVPIAALDIWHARQIANDPNVTRRDRISKYGQTYFSTTAALLSVAAFVVPAPLELIALKAASFAGFGSLGWSILSSRVVVNAFFRMTNALHIGPHRELELPPAPAP